MKKRRIFFRYVNNFAFLCLCSICLCGGRHIRKVCLGLLLGLTIIACLLQVISISSVIVCLNWKTKYAIIELCRSYGSGLVTGNLCEDLCRSGRVATVSCYVPHLAKDIVFTAMWKDRAVVIKSRHVAMSAFDPFPYSAVSPTNTHFTMEDFWQVVQDVISVNYDLGFKEYYLLQPHLFLRTVLTTDFKSATTANPEKLYSVLHSIWLLIQQKEYLTFKLFENSGLFPRIYGSCGHFYAMERLTPLSDLLFADWKSRTELAIKVVRLLEDAEYRFLHPLRICDMKMSHFGVDERQRLKILDGDDVYFQNVLNNIVCYNECRSDYDCSFFDCKMKCNFSSRTCNTKKVNSNLQAACEKMLTESGFFMQLFKPNLIHSLPPRIIAALAPVLKMCMASTEMSDSTESFLNIKEKIIKALSTNNY